MVKIDVGPIASEGAGAELHIALIAALVGVLLPGPGRPSLDHVLGLEQETPVLRGPTPVGAS